MHDFLREAGTIALLVIATGVCAVGWSSSFAYRPTEKKGRTAKAFMRATLLAGLSAFFACMIGTLRATQSAFEAKPEQEWWKILLVGTQESTNNLFLCAAWLSLAALFLAIGEARSKTA